jgi:hypothetical protein
LDGTIVVCDEAHNILYPPSDLSVVQRKLVATFRDRLHQARGGVAVLFTATPVLRHATDGHAMIDLVKGHEYERTACNEGFISWYMDRPPTMFAQLQPDGVGHDLRKAVVAVYIDSHPVFWQQYVRRRYGNPVQTRHKDVAKKKARDRQSSRVTESGFNHPCVKENNPTKRPCLRTLGRYEHIACGRTTDEAMVTRQSASELAPKLEAIAQSVADHNLRTVILIHRENGCVALVQLLQQHGLAPIFLDRVSGETANITRQRERENREAIQRFNNSVHPDINRVLVAVAEEYSEGVSFLNVRRIILADLSPGMEQPNWASVKQRMGRALRACSHDSLPVPLRTMWISLFVAMHRQPQYTQTIDEEKLNLVLSEMETIEAAMDELRGLSLDAAYFATAEPPRHVDRIIDPERFLKPSAWKEFTNYFTLANGHT